MLVSGRVTLKSGWLEDDPFPFGPADFLGAVYIMSNFGGGGISSSSHNPPVILVDGRNPKQLQASGRNNHLGCTKTSK